jgi:hypothetical protein
VDVLATLVAFEGELVRDCVADIGCSVTAVVGLALTVPAVPGRRPIESREVVDTRDAREPGRKGEGSEGVGFCCRWVALGTCGEIDIVSDDGLAVGAVTGSDVDSEPA